MTEIRIKDEYIKLGQLLKLAGIAGSGLEAKIIIKNGNVKVNGKTEMQRGKKIFSGDIVDFEGKEIRVI